MRMLIKNGINLAVNKKESNHLSKGKPDSKMHLYKLNKKRRGVKKVRGNDFYSERRIK